MVKVVLFFISSRKEKTVMIDPFDYKEPACALCGGKEFYAPDENAPAGRIPVKRIMAKLDESFNRNDMAEAGRLLEYWL